MKALSAAHEGKYMFLVVRDGRSFPCHVLKVEGKKVIVQETDHDAWPYTLRTLKLKDVIFTFGSEEVDRRTKDHPDLFKRDAASFFFHLREELNGHEPYVIGGKAVERAERKAAKKALKAVVS